jgi:hypothetical protein
MNSTVKINALSPGSKIIVPGINQRGLIDFVKVERGNIIYYAINYWFNGEKQFTTVHESEVELLP